MTSRDHSSAGILRLSIIALCILSLSLPAQAQKVWTGANSTDWGDGGNWIGGAPVGGDSVLITNALNPVLLDIDSPALTSLIISNNTLTLKNWDTQLDADDITIRYNGKFALPGSFQDTEMSNRIYVICNNLTVEQGGSIDADAGGFYPWDGPGAGSKGLTLEAGAGYGGRGGYGDRRYHQSRAGYPYGSAAVPWQPGSGGGSDDDVSVPISRTTAGSGGGAIYIDASATVTVDGTITADGGNATANDSAAGSGGGIYIECATFEGSSNGLIRARGGDANATASAGGGGGGGRIAVNYGSLGAQAFVRFSCSPARVDYANPDPDNRWWCKARMGTLWLPDTDLLDAVLSEDQFTDCRIMGISSWSPASLTVSNCSVTFGTDGFELHVAGDVRIDTGGVLGIGNDWDGTNFSLYCGGDLVLTNGGDLWVYAGRTNSAAFGHGALVKVTNDVAIGPSSWIYPVTEVRSTNTASPRFIMDDLYVAKDGGINAIGRGYEPWNGPGKPDTWQAGAGHGGRGGGTWSGNGTEGGKAYGSVTMPLAPGSGGASYANTQHKPTGGAGGGVIRLDATNSVTVHGTLTAQGADAPGTYGSPGSGGSINIKCGTFGGSTNGLLTVQGGDAGPFPSGNLIGGGGGGRIAVDYQNVAGSHNVRFSAAPADREATLLLYDPIGEWPRRAQAGTLWLPDTQLLDPVLSENQFINVRLFGPTAWSPATLTVSNCWVTFAEPGFELDVAGDVVIGTNGVFGVGDESAGTNCELRCQSSLSVTDGGKLYVYAGGTNAGGKAYGALVKVTNTITVGAGSWIYPHCHDSDGGAPRFVMQDLILAAGGGIDAQGRGFDSYKGPGVGSSTSTGGGGGGYGGRGGIGTQNSSTHSARGHAYGDAHMPLVPGSGGGAYNSAGHQPMSGNGGGVVWIEAANAVTINGTVRADGMLTRETYGAGGSGGGIYIKCGTFGGASTGLVTAEGGDGLDSNRGGGGGGRIAVDYGSLAGTHDMRFTAAPSADSWAYTHLDNLWHLLPWPGTLSLPDGELLSETLPNSTLAGDVSLWFQDIDEWKVQNLTISGGWVGFGQDNFQLTVSNDLTITTGGELAIGEYSFGSNTTLAVGDNLVVTNGGRLIVFGGLTNAMGEGDVSAVVAVTNDMFVGAGSWVWPASHESLGGSPVFRMRHLVIDENGGFNADVKGYRGGDGPGHGKYTTSYEHSAGGGHGGRGGHATNDYSSTAGLVMGGPTYGPTNGPALPGSGASRFNDANLFRKAQAGAGGGAVRIEARGDVTVNGTITANGGTTVFPAWYAGGGGAGGGIYIVTTNFSGGFNAVVRADGSDAPAPPATGGDGAGGGGRITVWNNVPEQTRANYLAGGAEPDLIVTEVFADYWGDVSVTNGIGWGALGSTNQAFPGTAFYLYVPPSGTWELTVAGNPGLYGGPSPQDYGVNGGIASNSWITNSVISPTNETASKRWSCLGFDIVDYDDNPVSSGTSTQAGFQLTTNMTLTWDWTNEWLLTVGHGLNGNVNSNLYNGWQTNQVVINVITAAPDGGYIFNGWEGDFPVGHATDNPLEVTMDQARSITATFAVAIIETNYWSGTGTWDTVANWSEGHAPKSIDHAVVTSGVLTIDVSKYMASLIVSNGATLSFTNWTTTANVADGVTVLSNGLITSWAMATNGVMSNRVSIACTDLTVEPGGAIDVTAKGFAGWDGPGAGTNGSGIQAGGSYGGRAGSGYNGGSTTWYGPTYGSISQPLDIGSGGGSYKYADPHAQPFRPHAGAGGGAVRIEATGTVTVDGTIAADGGEATDDWAAAGSGGSIYIICATMGGSDGVLRVRGGTAYNTLVAGGAGGGGRIAVDYSALAAQRTLQFCAAPGARDWGCSDEDQYWQFAARMGTLWLPDTNLLASPISDNLVSNACVYIDGVSVIEMDSLTISNASLTFPTNAIELRVAGDLVIGAGGELGIGGYYDAGSDHLLAVGGNITLTNGGELHVYAGSPVGGAGTVGTVVSVTNDLIVGPSSWVVPYCHPEKGSISSFVMENFSVAAGGGFNAVGRGHKSRQGDGIAAPGGWASGSGHGGRGGMGSSLTTVGPVYGSLTAPVKPGSGGETYSSDTHWGKGSSGGGVVRITARGAVTVNGTIDADGADRTPDAYAGCGSGGSIYIDCDSFGGSGGLIRADGGESLTTGTIAGPGGGGRVAVDYNSVVGSPTVVFSVAAGSNGWAMTVGEQDNRAHHVAQDGTLSLPDASALSTVLGDHFLNGARIYFRDVSSWSPASLTISDCAVTFAQSEFALNVAGDITVDSGGVLGLSDDPDGSNVVLSCANLIVTNGGVFHVYAGKTNDSSQTYGTLVAVAQKLTIGPASWIHPWARRYNGATVQFTAQDVAIADGGGFNANSRGYYGHQGPGRGAIASGGGAGGGFGGRGGDNDSGNAGGEPYGSTNAPTQPGSSGGTWGGYTDQRSASGGGSVRVDASGTMTLNGTVMADGVKPPASNCGGSSGGGIYLFCGRFRGAATGRLFAEGGDGFDGNEGPGGGGRIAVWDGFTEAERTAIVGGATLDRMAISNNVAFGFNGFAQVRIGSGYTDPVNYATPGTVRFLKKLPPAGSLIMVR